MSVIYNKELPDYGDLIPVKEWIECCESGMFIDYDGSGYPVKDGKMNNDLIRPSRYKELPSDATHVLWMNK